MGIPKFFRWISERYPLTSQLIEENKIPEFDNLYIDFNGIIHNCSHPNDEDAHFRLSEEQIFTAIFTYVDHLFGKIKPKKLFFMAVDGVAPRAKMNQQRGRRFRSAREAKEVREKAERKGEVLPAEKAFDSNCITPGTPFMTRLSEQLKYFVNKKITEDANWRGVQVILSGHDVPGEGEHKIMEYIRLSKAQPDYNPNVRHCLYGLDADLIMLGLLSHDPHFCLLREEVKFGPARKKNNTSLEHTNFFLLHLCLFREYLDLEFRTLADSLPFPYNLEHIIDDFILLCVFVGNDFLPNLPDLHIHANALEKLFDIYKETLPKAGGYLNESGVINLKRLQMIHDALATYEQQVYEKEHSDMNWFKGKQRPKELDALDAKRKGNQLFTITQGQKEMFAQIKKFVLDGRKLTPAKAREVKLSWVNNFPARDRHFLIRLADELKLILSWDEYDEDDQNLTVLRLPISAIPPPSRLENGDAKEDSSEEEVDGGEAGRAAVDRVLHKYSGVKTLEEQGDFDQRYDVALQQRMDEWKQDYYREKLHIDFNDKDQVRKLAYRYVEGLQWVMHYYYSGVASWGWFYDYHYAPRISDLVEVDKMSFNFELGKPFRPFEQLMGVLPEASRDLIPFAYQDLMADPNSPILDFYPREFDLDLNGKKADWEAIVKIPFIDQDRLLKAMGSREHRLRPEEKKRNQIGTSFIFAYTHDQEMVYPSSLPGFFPPIAHCQCKMGPFNLPTLDGLHLIKGLCDGVQLGIHAMPGFPTLQTLPHTTQVLHHEVNVFQADSRNQSLVLFIQNTWEGKKSAGIAEQLIGTKIFGNWPFLVEGMVVAVSDSHFKYEKTLIGGVEKVISNPHTISPRDGGMGGWTRRAERIESWNSKRFGVVTGNVDVLVHMRPLKGLKRLDNGALVKDYEGPEKETETAVQLSLLEVSLEDPRYQEQIPPPISEEFPDDTKVFFLGEHAYGTAAQVFSTAPTSMTVVLAFFVAESAENLKFTQVVLSRPVPSYYPAYQVASTLGISGLAVAKVTSSFMALLGDGSKVNLGLSLKFEAKSLKVLNWSRKERGWEFSAQTLELIREYKIQYPEVFRNLDRHGDAMLKASELYPNDKDADNKVKAIRSWLGTKGVRDLDPVPLNAEALDKETIAEIEALANQISSTKSTSSIKKAKVQGVPRQAVLKPAHAVYRLTGQVFGLGDRVIMVQDSGGVPLCAKGVVVGLLDNNIDVVWDTPFIGGTTLGGRCSDYRGSTCSPVACLNLTHRQFVQSTTATTPPPTVPIHLRAQSGPAPPRGRGVGGPSGPVRIMNNPNRGRGGSRQTVPPHHPPSAPPVLAQQPSGPANGQHQRASPTPRGGGHVTGSSRGGSFGRGFPRGGRGAPPPPPQSQPQAQVHVQQRGRGSPPFVQRGRGFHPRGRGRGQMPAATPGPSTSVPS